MKKLFLVALLCAFPWTVHAACELEQNTAATVPLGPFVSSTDGVTPQTSLTITQADVRLKKNGGNYAQKNDTGAATHDELGDYDVDLNATDTNTIGNLRIHVQETGAAPVWLDCIVRSTVSYEAFLEGNLIDFDDIGIAYYSTIASVFTANEVFTMDTNIPLDDSHIGNEGWIRDSTGAIETIEVTDIDATNDRVTIATGDLTFSPAATDELWISTRKHTRYELTQYSPQTTAQGSANLSTLRTTVRSLFRLLFRSDVAVAVDDSVELAEVNSDKGAGAGDYNPEVDGLQRGGGRSHRTTIATITNNTSFTLTLGSADDNAYNSGCTAEVVDQNTPTQRSGAIDIRDYTGSTRRVITAFDPNVYTYAIGDYVIITCGVASL
jgi:hypothetical protein